MRLRNTGKAIGYSLSRIYNDEGTAVGATLFFKDLTRVEQLEERERLRDRLAAVGQARTVSRFRQRPSRAPRRARMRRPMPS